MTSCYQDHLKQKHANIYVHACQISNLKHAEEPTSAESSERAPFTLEMFYHLLMKWIVVDDQVSIPPS